MSANVIDVVVTKYRAVAQWDDGVTLTVRRNGTWSTRRNCVEGILACLDGARGECLAAGESPHDGMRSIYLTLDQGSMLDWLWNQVALYSQDAAH